MINFGAGFFVMRFFDYDYVSFWLCEFDCTILVLVLAARVWCGFFRCESLVARFRCGFLVV